MERVEAGGNLHFLRLVHRVPVGHVHARSLQGGPAVGETVLHHQVLGPLGVDKGGDKGIFRGDDGGHVLHAQAGQRLLHHLGGAGGDLIDHGPGEGDLTLVGHPHGEFGGDITPVQPLLHHGHDAGAQLFPVVGAVVHAHHGDGRAARLEALPKQGGGHAHGVGAALRAVVKVGLDHGEELPGDVGQGVALLGDGVAGHLQRRAAEDLLQPRHVLGIGRAGPQALGHGGDNLLVHGTVGQQGHHQGHVIKGRIDFVDDVVVKGVGGHDAGMGQTLLQQILLELGDEAPEDIARPEVDPGGGLLRPGPHGLPVETGQSDPRLLPGGPVPNARAA